MEGECNRVDKRAARRGAVQSAVADMAPSIELVNSSSPEILGRGVPEGDRIAVGGTRRLAGRRVLVASFLLAQREQQTWANPPGSPPGRPEHLGPWHHLPSRSPSRGPPHPRSRSIQHRKRRSRCRNMTQETVHRTFRKNNVTVEVRAVAGSPWTWPSVARLL